LTILPTYSPLVVVLALGFGWAGIGLVAIFAALFLPDVETISAALSVVGSIAMVIVIRYAAHIRASIYSRMATFRVQNCICTSEEDRPLLYGNIVLLMRATDRVSHSATDEEALDAFNVLVRDFLPGVFINSIGPLGMRYKHVVGIFLCSYLAFAMDARYGGKDRSGERYTWWTRCGIPHALTFVFGLIPCALACLSVWCSRCLHLRGYMEWAYVGIGMLVPVGITYVGNELLDPPHKKCYKTKYSPNERREGLVVMFVYLCVWSLLAFAAFRWGVPGQEGAPRSAGTSRASTLIEFVSPRRRAETAESSLL